MSYDDHDLCGSFCECGPEVTPMTATERAEYQAETARLRAANVARVQQDAENLRAYDKAVRDALQVLRDTDHDAAVLEGIAANPTTPAHVAETAVMMLDGGRLDRGTVLDTDHAAALAACDICHQTEAGGHHAGVGHTFVAVADMLTYQTERMRLQVDDDNVAAVLANIAYDISTPAYVVETAVMMLRPENNRADVVTMDHADAIVENGFRHDPEPHSRRPSECRVCGKLIASTYVEGRRDQTWHVR